MRARTRTPATERRGDSGSEAANDCDRALPVSYVGDWQRDITPRKISFCAADGFHRTRYQYEAFHTRDPEASRTMGRIMRPLHGQGEAKRMLGRINFVVYGSRQRDRSGAGTIR